MGAESPCDVRNQLLFGARTGRAQRFEVLVPLSRRHSSSASLTHRRVLGDPGVTPLCAGARCCRADRAHRRVHLPHDRARLTMKDARNSSFWVSLMHPHRIPGNPYPSKSSPSSILISPISGRYPAHPTFLQPPRNELAGPLLAYARPSARPLLPTPLNGVCAAGRALRVRPRVGSSAAEQPSSAAENMGAAGIEPALFRVKVPLPLS